MAVLARFSGVGYEESLQNASEKRLHAWINALKTLTTEKDIVMHLSTLPGKLVIKKSLDGVTVQKGKINWHFTNHLLQYPQSQEAIRIFESAGAKVSKLAGKDINKK